MKKADKPNELTSNMRSDKSYSEAVKNDDDKQVINDSNKGGKKNKDKPTDKKEDFQDPKILKDTSQMNELKEFMKTIAEKVETLMTERNYYHQWNWVPQQNQNLYYQQQ